MENAKDASLALSLYTLERARTAVRADGAGRGIGASVRGDRGHEQPPRARARLQLHPAARPGEVVVRGGGHAPRVRRGRDVDGRAEREAEVRGAAVEDLVVVVAVDDAD
jgi:hypothetical protein